MTDTEFREWAEAHAILFRMLSEEDKQLFRAWKPTLIDNTLADLKAASVWIASNRAEKFRTEHLQLLQQFVRHRHQQTMRAYYEAQVALADQAEARNRCNECEGRGKLTVPRLEQIQDGRWIPSGKTFYEAVVACRCRLGVAIFERLTATWVALKKPAPGALSIGDYELHNPDWRRQLAEREEARKAQRIAEAHSRDVDRLRGPLAWAVKQALKPITRGTS